MILGECWSRFKNAFHKPFSIWMFSTGYLILVCLILVYLVSSWLIKCFLCFQSTLISYILPDNIATISDNVSANGCLALGSRGNNKFVAVDL